MTAPCHCEECGVRIDDLPFWASVRVCYDCWLEELYRARGELPYPFPVIVDPDEE